MGSSVGWSGTDDKGNGKPGTGKGKGKGKGNQHRGKGRGKASLARAKSGTKKKKRVNTTARKGSKNLTKWSGTTTLKTHTSQYYTEWTDTTWDHADNKTDAVG